MKLFALIYTLLFIGCKTPKFLVRKLSDFPIEHGVTGAATGLVDNKLVVAGGCYFPDGKPWEGGKKFWDNKIYMLDNPKAEWQLLGSLPTKISYSASLSFNNELFIFGGEDEGKLTDSVLKLTMVGQQIKIDQLPPLPELLSKASVTSINKRIYIFGGKSTDGASNKVWSSPLPYTGNWRKEAVMPFGPRTACSVVAKDDEILLFSGKSGNKLAELKVHHDVWKFDPQKSVWRQLLTESEGIPAMSTPILLFNNEITIWGAGGSTSLSLHQRIENAKKIDELKRNGKTAEVEKLLDQNRTLMKNDAGHSGKIRIFNLENKTFTVVGDLQKGRVGTKAINWHNGIVIPCGEVRPGIRTTNILFIKGVESE